jgi:hypothetical protein
MDVLRWVAEHRIQAAMDDGAFDELAGQGEPLSWDPADADVTDEWRMAFRVLKNARVAPRWVELDKQVRKGAAQARRALARSYRSWPEGGRGWQRAVDRFREEADRLNAAILVRNCLAPDGVAARNPLRMELELARLRAGSSDT